MQEVLRTLLIPAREAERSLEQVRAKGEDGLLEGHVPVHEEECISGTTKGQYPQCRFSRSFFFGKSWAGGNDKRVRLVVQGMSKQDTPKPLANVDIATIRVLKKYIEEAEKGRREELGQSKATFSVDREITLRVQGTLKVSESDPDRVIAQAAKPWRLFATLLQESNKRLRAAGEAGIDLDALVALAEKADSKLESKAKEDTKAAIKRVKDEVRGFVWGQVRVSGSVETVEPKAKEEAEPEPKVNVPF